MVLNGIAPVRMEKIDIELVPKLTYIISVINMKDRTEEEKSGWLQQILL